MAGGCARLPFGLHPLASSSRGISPKSRLQKNRARRWWQRLTPPVTRNGPPSSANSSLPTTPSPPAPDALGSLCPFVAKPRCSFPLQSVAFSLNPALNHKEHTEHKETEGVVKKTLPTRRVTPRASITSSLCDLCDLCG